MNFQFSRAAKANKTQCMKVDAKCALVQLRIEPSIMGFVEASV